jgi:hypothetical protein
MVTATMTDGCEAAHTVEQHCRARATFVRKLKRDYGADQSVWVREFQSNGSVHWHIFLAIDVAASGAVNEQMTRDLSAWWAEYYGHMNATARDVKFMKHGDGRDFLGSVRVEQLREDAAGRYAGKEGAKRFQKLAPPKWKQGGAWWRGSRGLTCTPLFEAMVPASRIAKTLVEIKGNTEEVAYRMQYCLGLKLQSERGLTT